MSNVSQGLKFLAWVILFYHWSGLWDAKFQPSRYLLRKFSNQSLTRPRFCSSNVFVPAGVKAKTLKIRKIKTKRDLRSCIIATGFYFLTTPFIQGLVNINLAFRLFKYGYSIYVSEINLISVWSSDNDAFLIFCVIMHIKKFFFVNVAQLGLERFVGPQVDMATGRHVIQSTIIPLSTADSK